MEVSKFIQEHINGYVSKLPIEVEPENEILKMLQAVRRYYDKYFSEDAKQLVDDFFTRFTTPQNISFYWCMGLINAIRYGDGEDELKLNEFWNFQEPIWQSACEEMEQKWKISDPQNADKYIDAFGYLYFAYMRLAWCYHQPYYADGFGWAQELLRQTNTITRPSIRDLRLDVDRRKSWTALIL